MNSVHVVSRRAVPATAMKAFVRQVRQSKMACQNLVQDGYIDYAADQADIILAVGEQVERVLRSGKTYYDFSKMKGFALLKVFPGGVLYVDLICGKGLGSGIFAAIDNLAASIGSKMIRLSAIPEAMMRYYQAYNFKFTESCEQDPAISNLAERASMSLKVAKRARNQEAYATSPGNRYMAQQQTKNASSQAMRNVSRLSSLLSRMDIVHNKGCKTPAKCGVSGYSMSKCLQ